MEVSKLMFIFHDTKSIYHINDTVRFHFLNATRDLWWRNVNPNILPVILLPNCGTWELQKLSKVIFKCQMSRWKYDRL